MATIIERKKNPGGKREIEGETVRPGRIFLATVEKKKSWLNGERKTLLVLKKKTREDGA